MSLEVFLICSFKKLRSPSDSKYALRPVQEEYYTNTLSKLRSCRDERTNDGAEEQNLQWMLVSQPYRQNPRMIMASNKAGFAVAPLDDPTKAFIEVETKGETPEIKFRSFGIVGWRDILVIVSSIGTMFFKHTNIRAEIPSFTFLFHATNLNIPENYLGMSSPNLSRNFTVSESGLLVLLSATGLQKISTVDLRKLRVLSAQEITEETFASVVCERTTTCIVGEVAADVNADIVYFLPYYSGILSKMTSQQLRRQDPTIQTGAELQMEYSPRSTALAVPSQTTLHRRIYRHRTYMSGMICNSDEGTELLACLSDMKTGQILSKVDLLSASHGCGPLHSIKEVAGSRGTLFLVNSDERYSHLVGSYNLKLQILQVSIPTAIGQMFNVLTERVSPSEFKIYSTDGQQAGPQPVVFVLKPV